MGNKFRSCFNLNLCIFLSVAAFSPLFAKATKGQNSFLFKTVDNKRSGPTKEYAVMRVFKSKLLFLVVMIAVGFGCAKKEEEKDEMKVETSILRLDVDETASLAKTWIRQDLVDQEILTTDVKILSLKIPIGKIGLGYGDGTEGTAAGSNSFPVYECPGDTNDECLLDLTTTALENLLKDAPALVAPEGTYNKLDISPCVGDAKAESIVVKMKAEATIDGKKYYSNVKDGLSLTGPAEEIEYTNVFGCSSGFYLVDQLVIGDGEYKSEPVVSDDEDEEVEEPVTISTDTIPVKLYFDIASAAYASGGTSNTGAVKPSGNCYGKSMQTPYLCINFPSIAGTVDDKKPSVKRFLVSESGTSGTFSPTIFGFYFGSKDTPFGAYQRLYFSGENYTGGIPQHLMGSMFKRFVLNADKSVKLDTYMSWLKMDKFQFKDHTGTVVLDVANDPASNPDSILNGTFEYSATLMK